MIIQHNIPAWNSHRQLGLNNAATAKNLEKLSSGYRINRAGDDAAGLAISEKMRGQIRGLAMAEMNVANGISLIQTAEGGLQETHAILQRMRELAVQSANGTYDNDVDRYNLNKEVIALKSEIDRISSATHYNGINLLDGTMGADKAQELKSTDNLGTSKDGYLAGSYNGAVNLLNKMGFAVSNTSGAANGDGYKSVGYMGIAITDKNFENQTASLIVKNDGVATGGKVSLALQVGDKTYLGEILTAVASPAFTAADSADGATALGALTANTTIFRNDDGKIVAALVQNSGADLTAVTGSSTAMTVSASTSSGVITGIKLGATAGVTLTTIVKNGYLGKTTTDLKVGDALYGARIAVNDTKLTFQIGANGYADQRVGLHVDNMSTSFIGTAGADQMKIADISIATQEDARKAIDVIGNAINQVSSTRADMGALQNRLEHTSKNLGVTKENLQAAESVIRDVDMAKEMMEFQKNQILVQASQAMLAQANALPQGVLQLLR